jgi:hypothetical protein
MTTVNFEDPTWHRRKSGREEYRIGGITVLAARVVITGDLPDEARLALLNLDVTTEELRGKLLWWDSAAGAWLPSEAIEAEPKDTA